MSLLSQLTAGLTASGALRRGIELIDKGDAKRAFPLFTKAARSGLAEAEYRVGRCYIQGVGVPPSKVEGVRWLERAATQNHTEAQSLLATMFIHGMVDRPDSGGTAGVLFASMERSPPDFINAQKWARQAAESGSSEAQALLGYILTSGPEEMRNLDEATGWYKRSAEAGCPQGHLGYALALARETSLPEVQAALVKHLRAAADQGLATALFLLGTITDRGVGVERDPIFATSCYRQAAEKGHHGGMARWGFALIKGIGAPANLQEGESWLRRAALAGDAEAAALELRLVALVVDLDQVLDEPRAAGLVAHLERDGGVAVVGRRADVVDA